MGTTMMYKNENWLRDAYKRHSKHITAIAEEAGVSEDAIDDHLKKLGIYENHWGPSMLSQTPRQHRADCGIRRQRLPDLQVLPFTPAPNILVFGANGFVGRNLMRFWEGCPTRHVTGLSRQDCDLMDRDQIDTAIEAYKADVVVHLAAFVGGIGLNAAYPADMMYRNLQMGINVVDACYTNGVEKLIYLGTVCSYPHTPPRIPFNEDDLWKDRPEPTNEPYGVAKKTIGMMLAAYEKQYNFQSTYLLPTNMYGPYDDFSPEGSHVIPAMIRKFLKAKEEQEPVILWGSGTPSRDFLYVEDCCLAIDCAIPSSTGSQPINIGSGIETNMRELASAIAKATDYKPGCDPANIDHPVYGDVIWDTTKPDGQPRRCLSVEVADKLLGFKAVTNLGDGIQRTVEWYKTTLGGTS